MAHTARLIPGFTAGLAGTAILWSVLAPAPEPREVEFTTTTPAPTRIDTQALAVDYAAEHGLTDCVDPAQAFASGADVVLTVATDEVGTPVTTEVVPVTLDEALDSAGVRVNVAACKAGE